MKPISQIIKEGEEVVLEKNCRLTESYEQVRWETLCAILKSQLGIDIYEFAGVLHLVKNGQPFADVRISGENKN